METSDSQSLEGFLEEWKRKDPILFRYYLLSYRSRSLQEASFEAPRAIMFSPVGDFMASFNGHEEQAGFDNLELIRFNHDQARFDFYEVSWSDEGPKLSDPNPRKCLDCHQSLAREGVDPRPNWEPYFLWPGFYGSADSKLLNSSSQLSKSEKERLSDPKDSFILEEIDKEKVSYEFFWKSIQPENERYSLLTPHNPKLGLEDARVYGTHARLEIKNSLFTQRVTQYNFLRVARLMGEDQEFFAFFKDAVFATLKCSPVILPDSLLQWLYANSSLPRKNHENSQTTKDDSFFNLLELGDRLKLLFEPFYFETDDWSMDFKTDGRFAFSTRFGTPGLPEQEFKKAILLRYPEFSDYEELSCLSKDEWEIRLGKYSDISQIQEAQRKREGFKRRIEAVKNTPLIQRCARCHVSPSSSDTPLISFGSELDLQKQLVQKGYPRGSLFDEIVYRIGDQPSSDEQMPPRGIATSELRNELIEYLKELIQ